MTNPLPPRPAPLRPARPRMPEVMALITGKPASFWMPWQSASRRVEFAGRHVWTLQDSLDGVSHKGVKDQFRFETPAEAWEAIAPVHWSYDPWRIFADSVAPSGWPSARREGGYVHYRNGHRAPAGAVAYEDSVPASTAIIAVVGAPPSFELAAALASDPIGVETAEAIARETPAGARARTVLWLGLTRNEVRRRRATLTSGIGAAETDIIGLGYVPLACPVPRTEYVLGIPLLECDEDPAAVAP